MKTLTLILGLCLLSCSCVASNPSMKSEVMEKVQPDLTGFHFASEHENFVVVSLKVNERHLEIIDIMGSSEKLVELIRDEILNLKVDKIYPAGDTYNFKFIFKKQ